MTNPFFFPRLSLHKRLPLLICVLLLSTVFIFSYTSYLEVKRVSLSNASERLHALTAQISSMFQQGGEVMLTAIQKTANEPSLRAFLQSNGKDSGVAVQHLLLKERSDTLIPLVQVLTAGRQTIMNSSDSSISGKEKEFVLNLVTPGIRFAEVGRIHQYGSKLYFPIVTSISDESSIIGYLVKWRRLVTSQAEIDALSRLMGAKSAFYIANDDGSFWTNGLVPIPAPPVNLKQPQKVISFNVEGEPVIGAAQLIPRTRWMVLITLSAPIVTAPANQFLYRMIGIGAVLVIAGIFLAWLIGRSITEPLNKLTKAAEAVATGNYDLQIRISRKDELGKLANAFSIMTQKRKKYEDDLQFSGEQLRQLATHLQNVREEERIGIAREIHDVIGQQLTAIKFDVHWLSRKINPVTEEARKKFDGTMQLIDSTIQASRKISSELRPDILNDLGLVEALQWQSNEFQNRTGIYCRFSSSVPIQIIEKGISFGLFRVFQEALTNTARHSEATAVNARLEYDNANDRLVLKISDNGKGFDPDEIKSKKRLGILGMQERVLSMLGTCLLESSPGKGTCITVAIPL